MNQKKRKLVSTAIIISMLLMISIPAMIQLGARQVEASRQKLKLSPNFEVNQFINIEETPVMKPEYVYS